MSDLVKKIQVVIDGCPYDFYIDDCSDLTIKLKLDKKLKPYVHISRRYDRGLRLFPTTINNKPTLKL